MKIFRTVLHYWFVIVSVFSFLVGWGMLAHSLKPIQPTQTGSENAASQLNLPPIRAFGSGQNFSIPGNQSGFGFPILRSGGS
jgi:hypothetical protein